MKKVLFTCLVVLLILVLPSCKQGRRIQPEGVDHIVFTAMPKGIERIGSITSYQVLRNGGRDTLITDRLFIQKFTHMVNNLQQKENGHLDMRSAALIATKTGDTLIVVFGEKWGTAILWERGKEKGRPDEETLYMDVNGDFMKDNPRLFRFIDKRIYSPHSNSYWFSDDIRALHQEQEEYYRSHGLLP